MKAASSAVLPTLLVNTAAALFTVGFLGLALRDEHMRARARMGAEPGVDWVVIGLWVLWSIGPYLGLALLGVLIHVKRPARRVAVVASLLIAVPALVLVSPLVDEPPTRMSFSWSGTLKFLVVPIGQWALVLVAAIVAALVWFNSRTETPQERGFGS
jgi:hypothetical protein